MIGSVEQAAPRAPIPKSPIAWASGDTPTGTGTAARAWPPKDWPSTAQLTYTRELITVVLLLLALPWILTRLAKRPRSTSQALASKALP